MVVGHGFRVGDEFQILPIGDAIVLGPPQHIYIHKLPVSIIRKDT